MSKRILSFLLAVVLLLSAIPLVSFTANAYADTYPLPTLTGDQAVDTVNIALSQLGYAEDSSGGTAYGAWWTSFTNWGVDYTNLAWCAMFACWCANQAGAGYNVAYDKNSAQVTSLLSWLKNNATADTSFSTTPVAGDFIFFENGSSHHVAIVIEYDSSTNKVTFVGGNQSNKVTKSTVTWSSSAKWGSQYVVGYGRPNYSRSVPEKSVYFGIDVSHHQGTINWDTVKPQIDFAILRCGYGSDMTSQDDRQWKANADACTRLGIPFGVYIYSYATTDAQALSEAEHVLRLVQRYNPTLPIYLDLEDSSILNSCSKADILRHTQIFCDKIESAGYEVGVYANYNWWTNYLTASEYDNWDRWIARYASATGYSKHYSTWQYTSSGSIDGISGNVDLNYRYEPIYGGTVSSVKPGKPVLKEFNRNYDSGEVTFFYWDDTINTTHYNLYIDRKGSDGEWEISYRVWHYAVSGFSAGFEDGIYRVKLQSTNSNAWTTDGSTWEYTNSDYVIFAVGYHDHDRAEYAFYEDAHPHRDCYYCSICGEIWRDLDTTNKLDSCDACSDFAPIYVEPGIYTIHSAWDNEMVLDIQGDSKENKANIQLYEFLNNDVQKFRIIEHGNYYVIQSVYSGLWLDVAAPVQNSGSNVQLYETNELNEEKWIFEDAGNGYVYIRNYYGCFLDIAKDAVENNANIQVYHSRESNSQRWLLVKAEHEHSYEKMQTVDATCGEQGYTVYTCSECGDSYKADYVPALDHAEGEWIVDRNPTCTASGSKHTECTRCGERLQSEIIPSTGHTESAWITDNNATCTASGSRHTECLTCGIVLQVSPIPATGHSWDNGVVTTPPTEEAEGVKTYTCTVCGASKTEPIPVLGHVHSYSSVVTAPTCTEQGYTLYTCSCGDSFKENFVDALGHNATDWIVDLAPTCTEGGAKHKECTVCKLRLQTESIPALGHDYASVVTEPTCTEAGYTTYTCEICGHSYTGDAVPATGHDYEDGSCTHCGAEDPDWTEPEDPFVNPFIDVKENDYFYAPVLWAVGEGITNGTTPTTFSPYDPCTRGQIVTFLWRAFGSPSPKSAHNPFTDVSPNLYYYTAVLWAVEQGITTGTSATTFSPEATCTRGQVATFLWRACGKPAPKGNGNPFSDVPQTVYYYQPILWAVENGITNGTGGGKFSPEDSCTRGQIVTFLYRALAE